MNLNGKNCKMNGYDLTRKWYDFKFNNPCVVKHIHSDLYFYIVDLWNRLGQKKEIGLPTSVTMEVLCIGSYNTYKKALDDLIKFGFIKLISSAKNQHQSKIIALSKIDKAKSSTLDKANQSALSINEETPDEALDKATDEALDTIIEQQTINNKQYVFDDFWNLYGKKKDTKKCKEKWTRLKLQEKKLAMEMLPRYIEKTPNINYRKNPLTWLNGACWEDEKQEQSQLDFGNKNKELVEPLEDNKW